jgi:potassium efflux system protein
MPVPELPAAATSTLRRLTAYCLLAVCLALTAAAMPVQAQNKNAAAEVDKTLDAARSQIDRVQKKLDAAPDKPLQDHDLVDLRNAAQEAQEQAQGAAAALEPQLASVQARMAELGQPAEGMKEAPDVAAQRAELTKNSGLLDAQIKLARLIAVEAQQAGDQILKLRRTQFQAELGVRTESILAPPFWTELRNQLPRDLRRLLPIRDELAESVREAGAAVWAGALLAVIAVLLLRTLAGRLLWRLTTTRVAPGRLRRSLYAAAQVVLATIAPGVIAAILRLGVEWNTALSTELDTLLSLAVGAVYFGGFVAGLGRALLSADRPTWRLASLPDEVATGLRWFPALLAIALVMGWIAQKLAALVNASLSATVAQNCILSLVLGALMALAMRRATQLRRRALAEQQKPRAEPAPVGYAIARGVIWAAVSASIISLLLGYIALGSFIVRQTAWFAIVLGATYLLSGLIDDACQSLVAAIKRNADDENYSRPMTRVRSQATVLLAGLSRLAVVLFALVLLAAPFGDGPTAWLQRLDYLHNGIAIGEVQIRPASVMFALLVLVLGFGMVRVIQAWLARQYLPTTSLDPGMRLSAATLFGYAGYVLAVSLSLSAVGIGLERVAWIASALSVGIGFGLQAVVQNFVSGLILLAERPVKVGDWVSLGGVEGDIRRINVRATEIQMGDHSTVIVPNSEFITKVVRNVTHASPLGRVQIKLALPLNTHAEQVRDLMLAAFMENADVLDEPMPDVMLDGVDANGLVFNATGHVISPRAAYRVRSALLFDILRRLRDENLSLVNPPTMVLRESAASGAPSDAASDSGKRSPDSPAPGTGLA